MVLSSVWVSFVFAFTVELLLLLVFFDLPLPFLLIGVALKRSGFWADGVAMVALPRVCCSITVFDGSGCGFGCGNGFGCVLGVGLGCGLGVGCGLGCGLGCGFGFGCGLGLWVEFIL